MFSKGGAMSNSKKLAKAHSGLVGELAIPGDKSISHRAVMFGAMANGITEVTGFLPGADCLSTIACFRKWVFTLIKKTIRSQL